MRVEDELCSAAACGNTERVEELLQHGADVNAVNRFGYTPIQVMMMGSARVARSLLSRGADPRVSDPRTRTTALHDAARGGFTDTVRVLLEFGADRNARDHLQRSPAQLARAHGHHALSELLDGAWD